MVSVVGICGPWFAPFDPAAQFTDELLNQQGLPHGFAAEGGHLLGGDAIGRDELSRLLHGGRISLQVAFLATFFAGVLGLGVGLAAGYARGSLDFLAMRSVDFFLSLPFLLIAIALNRIVDAPSLYSLALLLGALSWMSLARVTRSKTMQVMELDYIEAARALGYSHTRIILRHLLPNVLGPALVIATTMVAQMILVESAMSYLGLGVQPPLASWGSMLREGQSLMTYVPRLVALPGFFIALTVFGFNLLGEALRDVLDAD